LPLFAILSEPVSLLEEFEL